MNTQNNFRPYWFDQAMNREENPSPVRLDRNIHTDICIVGGSYTGLWTAIMVKGKKLDADVVVIDKDYCGYGASGSNGGCLITLATKFLSLRRFYGETEARRLVRESEASVTAIENFVRRHGIDCGLRTDGAVYVATNTSQCGVMDPVMAALSDAGLNS